MTLGEQRRKALELLAPPPSRHFEQAFHLRHVLPKSEHKLCKTPANQGTLTLVPFELILGRTSLERSWAGGRALRPGSAEPERGSLAPGGALEIRLQGHQVDRADQVGRGNAADQLEQAEPPRVRLLLERES
jgi:hypothetical protein